MGSNGDKTSPAWHSLSPGEAMARLGVEDDAGLASDEAARRLAASGPNRIVELKREELWEVFLEAIREPMILLLLATGVFYSIWGEPIDAATIFGVILTLVGVEVLLDYRAERAVAALQKLAEPMALVRRDGKSLEIPADQVVTGDIVLLVAGRRVPADARLVEAQSIAVDESLLTGESAPLEKDASVILPKETEPAERRNQVFAGTVLTRGHGAAVVVATGRATEMGRVAHLVGTVRPPRTPLEETMRELTRWMVWIALGVSVTVPVLGWLVAGEPVRTMILTGLALAFATIPEELPIIITMVLALGAYRLSRRRAIVKRLKAVETLGAVTVIATDKTGTLTENRIRVSKIHPVEREGAILELGVMCNSAMADGGRRWGDPIEMALLDAAEEKGIDAAELRGARPVLREFPFDNMRKRMSVAFGSGDTLAVAVKGAPESVLEQCISQRQGEGEAPLAKGDRERLAAVAGELAGTGLRVLAFAEKAVARVPESPEEAERGLTFLGMVGMADPPRAEARAAVETCRSAGIRVVMVTGDHPLTARAVAGQVGLNGNGAVLTGRDVDALPDAALADTVARVSVFARTTPDHKLRILQALRDRGEMVAVTGDGVNDAPALAAADIGVAMGHKGTDVAREASAMVLADDNFGTIVEAVREGRLLFDNLTKAIRYYLACKVALAAAILAPVLLGVPVPFAPIQIILMELLMDLAASATFVAEAAESDLMRRSPRNARAPFMSRDMVRSIVTAAAGLAIAVAGAYLVAWFSGATLAQAQTVAFVTWLVGHVLLALNLRSEKDPVSRLGYFSNRLMVAWGALAVLFVLVAVLVPPLHTALRTTSLGAGQWALALSLAVLGTMWIEAFKLLGAARRRSA